MHPSHAALFQTLAQDWEMIPSIDGTSPCYTVNACGQWIASVYLECVRERVEITLLQVSMHLRNQGHGKAILHTLCTAADAHGVTLCLHAAPIGKKPMKPEDLISFYERSGFERMPGTADRGQGVPMRRVAGSPDLAPFAEIS